MATNPNRPIVIGTIGGKLTIDAGSELTTSLYGLDTLTRPFHCITGELWKYTPRKYAPDPEYPKMYYIETRVIYREGLLTRAELIYSGRARGLPDAEIQDDKRSKTATIPFVFGAIGADPVQLEYLVQYLAPSTTYTYVTDRKPGETPLLQYSKVRLKGSPLSADNITKITVRSQDGAVRSIPPNFEEKVFKHKGVLDFVESFSCKESIPGKFWECVAVITKIIDPALTDIQVNVE